MATATGSRAAMRWWGWSAGRPPRGQVKRKWALEDSPEVVPLVVALTGGVVMAVGTMAYQLLYNPSIM